jgi:Fur family peroxide stress response transcriptional regulator
MHSPPDSQLENALRERGLRVTPQRVLINRALRELDRHVSADEVLAAVSEHLPNASLPTVYSTLELLGELGMVRRVSAGSGAALFDPRTEEHQHLVCRNCRRVEDLDVKVDTASALRAARRHGFEPADAELVVSGLCERCAAQAERQAAQSAPIRSVKSRGRSA